MTPDTKEKLTDLIWFACSGYGEDDYGLVQDNLQKIILDLMMNRGDLSEKVRWCRHRDTLNYLIQREAYPPYKEKLQMIISLINRKYP